MKEDIVMHISTPGERRPKPPTARRRKPDEPALLGGWRALMTAPIGGWRGFLVNAIVWGAVTWGVTRCLNALSSPDQNAGGRQAHPPPVKQERMGAQTED
jgi:hypothetical protein